MSATADYSVAVTHGNYLQWGGGEYVAEAIAETFDAPIYYGFGYDDVIPENGTPHIQMFEFPMERRVTRIADRIFQLRDLAFMWKAQHCPKLHEYDVVIHSGNEFGWYVPPDDQVVVKYVHSPPRSAYDLFPQEGESTLLRAYATVSRPMYRPTTTYPETHLANSDLVRRRIQKYWGMDAQVCYPPVDVDGYGDGLAETDETVYLTFNRLYRHKRTREIVEAFADIPDRTLLVGGEGPQRDHLEEIATENVEMLGYLDEDRKRELLSKASALIYNPVNEDFGMIPIEALASGTPVLGIRDGFTQYQIGDGVNGFLYDSPDADSIWWVVKQFESMGVDATPGELESFAENFSRDRFERQLRDAVDAAIEGAKITPTIDPGEIADPTATHTPRETIKGAADGD